MLWIYVDYKATKWVSLNGAHYQLIKKLYCYKNCETLTFCTNNPETAGCSIYHALAVYNGLVYDVDITDIAVVDQKLVITAKEDISQFLAETKTVKEIIGEDPSTGGDIVSLNCDDVSSYDSTTKLYSKNCSYGDNLNIVIQYP